MSAVLYDVSDSVATITLNRPETLNSMNDELMTGIRSAIQQVHSDESIRVVVLTGSGRGFCSGADLSAGGEDADDNDPSAAGDDIAAAMDDVFHPAIQALSDCLVPTIGRVNGVAAGGGFGLALCCDIVIAARSAFFVSTFGPRLGIVPDMGTTWHLPMLAGPARARGIAMLGDRISADQAAQWGLIWESVDDEELDSAVGRAAAIIGRSSPDAMTRIRSAIAGAERNSFADQLEVEREHQRILIPRNMAEGAAAFMGKREPNFDGARRGSN